LPGVPETASRPAVVRPRLAVAYWAGAIVLYGLLGAVYPPLFLLGFWESIPWLLAITVVAGRLFPRRVPPLPPDER
jgi:hypothetical protein